MSHKKKNPIPAKQLTLADVTSNEYQPWKVRFVLTAKRLSRNILTITRLKATVITKDCYIPTRLKQWIEVVDRFGHKHMKKVPAGEGVLKEYNKGNVVTLVEETTTSARICYND